MSVKTVSNCMGCGMCAVVCNHNGILFLENKYGFLSATVTANCIECGLCDKICPAINTNCLSQIKGSYAVFSNDSYVLETTSSGGIAYELAKKGFADNMAICGVKMNDDCSIAEHFVCKTQADLELTKGSKYIASYTTDAFNDVIKQKRKAIIFGSPCQIKSFSSYVELINRRDDFLLVDFFCHGVPSYFLWKKQLSDIRNQFGNDVRILSFRGKKYGWGNYCLNLEQDGTLETIPRDKLHFFNFFLGNYCLNNSCYTCPYHGVKSAADIRIGDLWGKKYKNNKTGVSGVLTFSQKGDDALLSLKPDNVFIEKEPVDIICEGQMNTDIPVPKCRKKVLSLLGKKRSLSLIYKTTIFEYKVIERLKKLFLRR